MQKCKMLERKSHFNNEAKVFLVTGRFENLELIAIISSMLGSNQNKACLHPIFCIFSSLATFIQFFSIPNFTFSQFLLSFAFLF